MEDETIQRLLMGLRVMITWKGSVDAFLGTIEFPLHLHLPSPTHIPSHCEEYHKIL